MRRSTRLGGVLAAAGLAAGLTLAVPGAASATAGCQAWDGTQPPASDTGFLGVAVAGPCDAWMVGYKATGQPGGRATVIEHWTGGPAWTAMSSPSPGIFAQWQAISADSPADVWAVGVSADSSGRNSGLALHWDGTSWAQKPVPDSAWGLRAVAAVSASDVWAGGLASTDGGAYLIHYDGTGWTRSLVPAITPAPGPGQTQSIVITGLTAISATDVWAVGWGQLDGSDHFPVILHWDGTAWTQRLAPAGSYELNAVSASGPSDAWAVGAVRNGGPISTVILHWDGTSWIQKPAPGPADIELDGVAAISPTSALAVGDSGALRWDGQNWTQMPALSLPDAELFAVAAGPAGVWAAGRWEPASNQIQAGAMVFGTVPSVVGQSQAAALDALNSAGLRSTVTTVPAGGSCGLATNGTIIATTPAAGTFTAPPVSMTFCSFPVVTVPRVVGLSDPAARSAITSAGLRVGAVSLKFNCSIPVGQVLGQSPAGGTTVQAGSSVNLTEDTHQGTSSAAIHPHFCTP